MVPHVEERTDDALVRGQRVGQGSSCATSTGAAAVTIAAAASTSAATAGISTGNSSGNSSTGASRSTTTATVCVSVVLGDALQRVSVLGGREGMPRSLGSVFGGSVTRFLGGGLRGVVSRVIATPGLQPWSGGVAVSRDGSTLLVSDNDGGSDAIHEFSTADGTLLRVVGGSGDGPLQFDGPCQVWIAPDDFVPVFVVDHRNARVQVLTPELDFHGFVGAGQLEYPCGVCANADVVVVSEEGSHRISVFHHGDGAIRHLFGWHGSGDGQLNRTLGLCFLHGGHHFAVSDYYNCRVSVFSVDGECEFLRHAGVGTLCGPSGVAASACNELVVADTCNHRVVVISSGSSGGSEPPGEVAVVKAMGRGRFTAVAIMAHGGTVLAHNRDAHQCVVFD